MKTCIKCGREFAWQDYGSSKTFEMKVLCPDCDHEEQEILEEAENYRHKILNQLPSYGSIKLIAVNDVPVITREELIAQKKPAFDYDTLRNSPSILNKQKPKT